MASMIAEGVVGGISAGILIGRLKRRGPIWHGATVAFGALIVKLVTIWGAELFMIIPLLGQVLRHMTVIWLFPEVLVWGPLGLGRNSESSLAWSQMASQWAAFGSAFIGVIVSLISARMKKGAT